MTAVNIVDLLTKLWYMKSKQVLLDIFYAIPWKYKIRGAPNGLIYINLTGVKNLRKVNAYVPCSNNWNISSTIIIIAQLRINERKIQKLIVL